jgi:hypothetical protein
MIRPGQTAQLCYGIANAKSVRLEPDPRRSQCGREWLLA